MRLGFIESLFETAVILHQLSDVLLHLGCLREETTGVRVVYLAP